MRSVAISFKKNSLLNIVYYFLSHRLTTSKSLLAAHFRKRVDLGVWILALTNVL